MLVVHESRRHTLAVPESEGHVVPVLTLKFSVYF